MPMPIDPRWPGLMEEALGEARAALRTGDVPVGAVIADASGTVIARGRNRREERADPTAHAEVEAIRQATRSRGSWRLEDAVLVVTLEPCVMCAGAILSARIPTVVFGAWDEKAGAAGSMHDLLRDRRLTHTVEVVPGVEASAGAALLTRFFRGV